MAAPRLTWNSTKVELGEAGATQSEQGFADAQ